MSFLHLSLLAGLAAVAVPVMLHLFGQRQPQLIDFPALRFVKETTQEQRTSWQLRHFLLLLLRVLLLAALVFALARPRVHSATLGSILGISVVGFFAVLATLATAVAVANHRPKSVWMSCLVIAIALWLSAGLWGYQSLTTGPSVPNADQTSPVAAAVIIDNGPSMTYKSENEVRLDRGKDLAAWILDQLPIDSRVGILGGAPLRSLSLDPASALTQVNLIEPQGARIDLPARIRTAVDLVIAEELERKEVYVITDLMDTGWTSAQPGLKELLEEYSSEVLVQIIDVGDLDSANWRLDDAIPEFDYVPVGGEARFTVKVNRPSQAGSNTSATVELVQEEIDPRLPIIQNGELKTPPSRVVDRKVVDLSQTPSQEVLLSAQDLAEGTHHFQVRINRADPLPWDNARYVSIVAQPQLPTLVVGDDPELTRVLRYIADPDPNNAQSQQIRFDQLRQVDYGSFSVVCLYDPPALSENDVNKLLEHVESGGGLLLILGPRLGSANQINGNAITRLLPGTIAPQWQVPRKDRGNFLSPLAESHPVFQTLSQVDVAWQAFPIFECWTFEETQPNVQQLAQLSSQPIPILMTQDVGSGQIMTLTTPIPQTERRGLPVWNELWIGTDPWPAWALLLGSMQVLSGANLSGISFPAGVPVSLTNNTQRWPSRYELFLPTARSRRVESSDGFLTLGAFSQPGTYRLRGVQGEAKVRGFSVNVAAADTTLARIEQAQLDEQLGEGHYRIARSREEVESSVGQARFGRELYPLLMVVVAALFLAEQAMSNRFYQVKFRRARA